MAERPLSPHLQIYKIQITSLLSILHRMTGVILYGGAVLWVVWLVGLANGKESYNTIQSFLLHPLGLLLLLGWSLSFFYHFCNGIRHLCWDMGYGYDIKTVRQTGWFVVVMTIILTLFAWLLGKMWGFVWL